MWNELVISDLQAIRPFYEALFQWEFKTTSEPARYELKTADGNLVGHVSEVPNEIKGKLEYWAIYFSVSDLDRAKSQIEKLGGSIVYDQREADHREMMVTDPQGATFYLIGGQSSGRALLKRSGQFKWRSILGLGLVFIAIMFEINWVWSILFLLWIIPDMLSGITYFLEPVERARHPILFWSILGTWIFLSIVPLLYPQ